MSYLTTVPVLFGKGLNVWLGLVLLALVSAQITTGLAVFAGRGRFVGYHRVNAFLITLVMLVHAYYGIGIWFFGFRYAR